MEHIVVVNDNVLSPSPRKVRRKRQKRLLKNVCLEYTQNTSLQGIPFLTKRELTVFEKIFWVVTIIVSLFMCGYLIQDGWVKWRTRPVIVTVSEQIIPVMKVPLPSVTICPMAKCKTSAYNYSAGVYNSTLRIAKLYVYIYLHTENDMFEDVSLLCWDQNNRNWTVPVFNYYLRHYHDTSTLKNLNKVALDYGDIFQECQISNKTVDCQELFSKVVTSEGICYTMNSLAADEIFRTENIQKDFPYLNSTTRSRGWSIEQGYDDDLLANSSIYPRRGLDIGSIPNVNILFGQILEDHDKFCRGYSTGLNVYIQQPHDLPQASLHSYTLMNNESSSLSLSFSLMHSSEDLRAYDPEIRQCYFPNERYLKYFKIYTASNCRMECLSNLTFETCGCVAFYMPHDNKTICSLRHDDCIKNAYVKLAHIESGKDPACRCLSACDNIDYEGELLKSHYDFKKEMESTGSDFLFNTNYSRTTFSRMKIFYKRPQYLSLHRSELYGMTDFLATCGGLLGLFLGFSFMSLVEIIYYFTLRICCALRQVPKTEKAQEKEDQDFYEKF